MVEQVPAFTGEPLVALAQLTGEPVQLVARRSDGALGIAGPGWSGDRHGELAVVARLPGLYPEWLGDQEFTRTHGARFPYVAGEMAHGISGTALVSEMAHAEMLAFLGSAGLSPERLERVLGQLADRLGARRNWGANLIHQPESPALEDETAAVLLRARVPRISVSAYMTLTSAVVRCAATGLRRDPGGRIRRGAAVFAKVSRPEVAEQFMSPAPAELLRLLVGRGQLTADEARLAERVPVAEDVTVEADSGGHTDGRPLGVVLPEVLALRDELAARLRLERPVRVGAAGGLGDPASVAAAFALGAAYVVTGTVNQMSVEAAISDRAKALLAEARVTDVGMAPSSDMFEIGAKVQVLRRGTLFAARAGRLQRLYERYASLEALPDATTTALEREVLGSPVAEVWEATRAYWSVRDPAVIARAEADPRHRMALVFRWYLGSSSVWAIDGRPDRVADYQVWCGPAAGAFNRWTAGSFLADPSARTVTQIARNLMQGAAVLTRAHQLRTFGVRLPREAFAFRPRPLV
ncbi:PfaD family polyunsaturated fatty acid/polyketide biosynthesis protein [Streptomyces sp. NBC_00091]|uniref:PfaD family polyunsaturated fatty acid/polyketide biosynthesis protein n=1 Tax=Streptomyces sp. NBC_00091 TaxID=2975648 RepID=UPI002253A3A5|nr:PfaD family polyunsaturated fatty acid/polyketide biosynthesis protein [Streptomyces sp. NBC_00091]MCX5381493.1 PfaD family polyunsaturated fatty acid/polyketide biosynthesis protein [Streptomyces sp. NBC_00091]